MMDLSFIILCVPLLGFLILGLPGRLFPRPLVVTVGIAACLLPFLLTVINFFSMLSVPEAQRVSDLTVFSWISAGSFSLSFGQYLDPLSMTMLLVVTGVGMLIHIYSSAYMSDEPGLWRFFSFMNLFIFAMILLVTADSFVFLLIGWALVGLASCLLIGFWYQRPAALAAARKAFVINVIGDLGLMLAIFLLFSHTGSVSYVNMFGQAASLGTGLATTVSLLLFVACAAKSAQLPLYMWLPDAMEGPTPVSALIHAATMVTAGVYLVARTYPLFDQAPVALGIVAALGGATALFAATIALTQLDIKRVLAYSTMSQLGYMFMAEGVQNYTAGIFHLVTHAFFKALLFLGAGSVIHALGGEQDMRKMGGLWGRLRGTAVVFLIAALAISGIFPLAGFWSKDEILGSILARATVSGNAGYYILWLIGIITAGLTSFYMFRLFFAVFTGTYRGQAAGDQATEDHHHSSGIHESPPVMAYPMYVLAILSIIGGFIGSLALFGLPAWYPLGNFLSAGLSSHAADPGIGLDWISTIVSLLAALAGIGIAYRRYGRGFVYRESTNPFYQLSFHKYYVDEAFTVVLIRPLLALGRGLSGLLEGFTLDGGSRALGRIFQGLSRGFRVVQTGYMRNYALGILVGVVLIVVYYAVRG